jgi:NAD+ synthase (glutamine-hydrolysing)
LESDTYTHCWESLADLLERGATDGLLCDFGMPVLHNGTRYNCRVICLDKQILLIRPKTAMADNGNYRESRYFTPYTSHHNEEASQHLLPSHLFDSFGQKYAPFGTQFLRCGDGTCIGVESCEEVSEQSLCLGWPHFLKKNSSLNPCILPS